MRFRKAVGAGVQRSRQQFVPWRWGRRARVFNQTQKDPADARTGPEGERERAAGDFLIKDDGPWEFKPP